MDSQENETITTRHKTKSVTLKLESDVYDGVWSDTRVTGTIDLWIVGYARTAFLKSLDELMEKHRI